MEWLWCARDACARRLIGEMLKLGADIVIVHPYERYSLAELNAVDQENECGATAPISLAFELATAIV